MKLGQWFDNASTNRATTPSKWSNRTTVKCSSVEQLNVPLVSETQDFFVLFKTIVCLINFQGTTNVVDTWDFNSRQKVQKIIRNNFMSMSKYDIISQFISREKLLAYVSHSVLYLTMFCIDGHRGTRYPCWWPLLVLIIHAYANLWNGIWREAVSMHFP